MMEDFVLYFKHLFTLRPFDGWVHIDQREDRGKNFDKELTCTLSVIFNSRTPSEALYFVTHRV